MSLHQKNRNTEKKVNQFSTKVVIVELSFQGQKNPQKIN